MKDLIGRWVLLALPMFTLISVLFCQLISGLDSG